MSDARTSTERRTIPARGADDSWDWLLADGDCPICGRRHSRWIRRVAAWLGWREAA
jgi:hypothetical protein